MSFWQCIQGPAEIRFEGETKTGRRLEINVPVALLAKLGDAAIRFVEGRKIGEEPSAENGYRSRGPEVGHLFWHVQEDRPFSSCSSCSPWDMRGPVTPSGICPIDGETWEKHDELALGNHAKRMWRNDDLPKDEEGE
jgi:hypothetical protein